MIRCNFEAAELVNQDVLGKAEACKVELFLRRRVLAEVTRRVCVWWGFR